MQQAEKTETSRRSYGPEMNSYLSSTVAWLPISVKQAMKTLVSEVAVDQDWNNLEKLPAEDVKKPTARADVVEQAHLSLGRKHSFDNLMRQTTCIFWSIPRGVLYVSSCIHAFMFIDLQRVAQTKKRGSKLGSPRRNFEPPDLRKEPVPTKKEAQKGEPLPGFGCRKGSKASRQPCSCRFDDGLVPLEAS